MAVTNATSLFLPEVVSEAVQGYLAAGVPVLAGTGAGLIKMGLPAGQRDVGSQVKVPYFGALGEMEDVTDGVALTPKAFSGTNEVATILHSGIATEISAWAQVGGDDPMAEAARLCTESIRRRLDKAMLTAAQDATSWSSYIYDASGITTGLITYDAIVQAIAKLGDEADDLAALVVSSKVYSDMLGIKDGSQRPLLIDPTTGVAGRGVVLGIPIVVSDLIAPVSTKYTNLLLKKGALVSWVANLSDTSIQVDHDLLKDTDIAAIHLYHATHRYKQVGGRSKPGVIHLITK